MGEAPPPPSALTVQVALNGSARVVPIAVGPRVSTLREAGRAAPIAPDKTASLLSYAGRVMYDYPAAYDRRVRQFREYLVTMHDRAHEEVHGNCFLIFEERTGPAPGADVRARHETEARRSSAERRREPPAVEEEEEFLAALPSEGWRADDDSHRFVQFAFGRESFCVDLPRQTLYPLEAWKILRDRTGFFYLRDRPEFTLPGEEAEGYDPFRKVYVYGDEQAAAADAAFVFFDVWRFPVEARLYVTAAAFSGKASWEKGHPIS